MLTIANVDFHMASRACTTHKGSINMPNDDIRGEFSIANKADAVSSDDPADVIGFAKLIEKLSKREISELKCFASALNEQSAREESCYTESLFFDKT